jgi:hypothetical protein
MREKRRRGLSFRFDRERKKDRISIAKAAASNHLGWQGGVVIALLKEKLFLLIFFFLKISPSDRSHYFTFSLSLKSETFRSSRPALLRESKYPS